jgi:CubicO group peptidase (beta-lactamase class C family)
LHHFRQRTEPVDRTAETTQGRLRLGGREVKSRWLIAAALVLAIAPAAQTQVPGRAREQGQPATAHDPLVGVWANETTFGPALRGELIVTRDGSSLRARLGSAESKCDEAGDSIRCALPGNLGRFCGALTDDGRTITGFWLQPSGVTGDRPDPVGSRQAFATPLVLQRAGHDVWRGTVRPLEERFTLYLRIFRDAEDSLVAAFRNPEINSVGGASHFQVTQKGDSVTFSARFDDTSPEIRHSATLAHDPARLQIFWADAGRVLDLVRRTPEHAANFYPRPPGEPAYVYRKPAETGDGWNTAGAGDVGMDEGALTALVQRLIDADPSARRPALIHSMLLARRGKLVLEEYFFGYDRDTPHDTRSAGKTFASVMLGAAMMQGTKIAPETKVYDLLATKGPFANTDPRKSQITLAHLMTHTSGLACDDNDDASPGNENTMQSQRQQPDWWKYTLDLPMAQDPGSRYAYCSANMNLMGAALTTATGTWLPELFERTVARPLRFGPYHWNLMPTDEGYLGGGAWLRPRDLLKIGQAYLEGGVWRGQRIVDASWVARSTAPYVHIAPATTGLDAQQFSDFYVEGDDAYAWHLNGVRSGERVYRAYAATGNGGQVLIVVPEFDLVVVFTGGNYRQGGIWGRWGDEIVGGAVIPAIRR